MIINFILPAMANSGGSKVIYIYAKILSDMGNDVKIYSPMIAYNMHRYNSKLKNIVHQEYCTMKTIVKKRKQTEFDCYVPVISNNYIRKADSTIATSWPTSFDVAKLGKKCGDKWYFIQDYEIWDNKKYGLNSYKLPLKKIVISTWINNQIKSNLGIGPFPIVYNGIDSNIFTSANRKKHNRINLLMLNHTLEKKGVIQGLRVYKKIKSQYSNVRLRMFGICSNDNIPGDIEYFQNPPIDLLIKLYQDTDIFIFPSLEEGWGLTPLEAMACGCAVVGTRTGFVLDFGKHRQNMMISEPSDINQMYNNLEELINNSELAENVRAGGQRLAKELDWKRSASILVELLKEGTKG